MTTKQIINDKEKIIAGLNKAADVVKSTMGGQGKTVVISTNDEREKLRFTKDGVSVAKSIKLDDPIEDVGAQILISAANKTVELCGDGPQPLYSKILTPKGFITLGNIKKGDVICGTNNSTQIVEEVYDKGNKEIYKVYFSNNRIVECSIDHLWTIITNNGEKKTLPLSQIIKMKEYLNEKTNGKNPKGIYVPNTSVEFDKNRISVDPYLLGLLIGDGSLSGSGDIELSLGLNKEHVIDKIDSKYIKSINYIEEKNYFRIKLQNLEEDLKNLGLYGTTSSTKFIPKSYLYNTLECRRKLLEGLLDTDGHINKRNRFEYSTISKHLKNDFIELVQSLGISVNSRLHKRNNNSYSDTSIYRITQLAGYKYGNKILKIEAQPLNTPMRCIKVSNKDELYITDNYIVTHNTTLTSVLLQVMVNETINYIKKQKDIDINKLINDLESSVSEVVEYILKETYKVENLFHVKSIASTSANSIEIGNLFEKIYSETGLDALITLEKSDQKSYTYYDITKGIMFDSNTGFVHSSFMTNKDTEQAIYENAYIHIDEQPVSRLTDAYDKLIGMCIKEEIPLVIIAPRFSDSFIRTCSMNKVNNGAAICLVKTPGFGHGVKKNIDDIRAFLSNDGYVDKFMADAYKFILYNEDTPNLDNRIKSLTSLRDNAVEWYDEKDYNERLYRLKGSTAVIYAGGTTPEALSEEYDRLEDAIGAVKTAVQNGFVEGGGLTLFKAAMNLKLHKIIKNSCFAPLVQILDNANVTANIDSSDVRGFNVKTMQYENFIESGIIDPSNVLIVALQNALANTKLLINTSYTLYNEFKR